MHIIALVFLTLPMGDPWPHWPPLTDVELLPPARDPTTSWETCRALRAELRRKHPDAYASGGWPSPVPCSC
jgi:hypothetical protein